MIRHADCFFTRALLHALVPFTKSPSHDLSWRSQVRTQASGAHDLDPLAIHGKSREARQSEDAHDTVTSLVPLSDHRTLYVGDVPRECVPVCQVAAIMPCHGRRERKLMMPCAVVNCISICAVASPRTTFDPTKARTPSLHPRSNDPRIAHPGAVANHCATPTKRRKHQKALDATRSLTPSRQSHNSHSSPTPRSRTPTFSDSSPPQPHPAPSPSSQPRPSHPR